MEINITLRLPRDTASVPVSRQVLDACMQVLGVSDDTRLNIELGLSEACANVVQHAAPSDDYTVGARVLDDRCVIEVRNLGAADNIPLDGDPDAAPTDEHGRGMRIIAAVAENLKLKGHDHTATTLHFEIPLHWLPDAPVNRLRQDGPDGGHPARS